jgi:hypothetical protein
VERPSAIRTYAGVQVFSAFEDGGYRLAIRREGKVELLPVASSPAPFAADIGPDREGRPKLIYTRCEAERRDCDLFVFSLAGGARERPVRAANTAANEVAPTLWNGRIAFARRSKGRSRAAVYTRKLAAPRSRPSERLPAIPRRRREERNNPAVVIELELYGNHLAQIVNLTSSTAVRLVDISDHSSRLLDRAGVGEAGQHFAGIGFAHGYLAWAFGGAVGELAGIYRHRLSTGELAHASAPRVVDYDIAGLALFASDGAYMIDAQPELGGCGETADDPPAVRPCQLIRSNSLRFRPITG